MMTFLCPEYQHIAMYFDWLSYGSNAIEKDVRYEMVAILKGKMGLFWLDGKAY